MEDTQALHWEAEDEEETESPSAALGCGLEPLGRLRIFSSAHGPEKDFPLYLGKNVVGRTPGCSVALPFPSISKQHAVIEILARDKAPVLRDCGSLNGTQILRPPKFLSPGESHRLKDQELVVFADLPCQYHHRDISLPPVSWGPLTIEGTPRVQGGTQPWGVSLAEDSEEEVEPLAERCAVQGPRTTSSPLATVVPESDEEGSPARDGPGPSYAFTFDSDTDEEGSQQAAAGEASSAATGKATAETKHPEAIPAETQCGKDQHSLKERNNNTRVEKDASGGVVPVGGPLERSQPAGECKPPEGPAEVRRERAQPYGFIDSDTDVEEEEIPVTPAVLPSQRRWSYHGTPAERAGGPEPAQPGESPAGRDANVEEAEAPLTGALEQRQAAVVIDSDTDANDEEEVVAALALAHLKDSLAALWSRDRDVPGGAPPLALPGQDSDTDVQEGFPAEKREFAPKGHTDKARPEKSQPPFGNRDTEVDSAGVHLERSQAFATAGLRTQEPQVPVVWTHRTGVEADRRPATLPMVRPEEAQPPRGAPGESTQPQREEARAPGESGRKPRVDMTEDSGDSHGGSEDLDLQATQCFVERENESLAGALDESWEVLATQPFCLSESEASETQPVAAHPEARGSGSASVRMTPQDQRPESPVHAEPPGIQGRRVQTVEKGIGHWNCKMPPVEEASGGDADSRHAHLPPTAPEASALVQSLITSQSPDHPAAQPLSAASPSSSEPPVPRTGQDGSEEAPENPLSSELDPLHAEPQIRPQRSSRRVASPVPSGALEPHPTTLTNQPMTPEPTSRARWGRTRRSSVKTPEPVVPIVPEPVNPKSTSQGRTRRSSLKTPEPVVPIVSEPVNPKSTSRDRTRGSSVKTPDPVVPTDSELQPSTSKEQLVTPEPTSQAPWGRTRRSSVKTPEPVVPVVLEPVSPKSTSQDRTRRSSLNTPDPVVTMAPEPTSWAPWGRTHRSFLKTPDPVVTTVPEPTSRAPWGRTRRSSVKTPDPVVTTIPELQPSTSKDQPVTPEPTLRATRGRSSVKAHQPIEPTAPDPAPPTPIDQPVTPKVITQGGHSRKLRSTRSAVPIPPTPEFQSPAPTDQPIVPEPVPQASCSRRLRTTRKPGSPAAPIVYEPCSASREANSQASGSQRGAGQVAKSLRTSPEPVLSECPAVPTSVPQIQETEAAGRCALTPGSQPVAFPNPKRPSGTVGSPPLQKRLRRGAVPPKTVFLEEDTVERPGKEEGAVVPGRSKRKKGQAEEEPREMPGRSLRRTKPNHGSTAPRVLFTGVLDARGEQAVLALGGSLARSVAEATHLVTDRVRRTVKFLCALGRGLPILSLDWLHQSRRAGRFLPPEEYLVSDPEQEKNFGFSLRDSLRRARERRLLEGYEVHVTPGVQPPPPQMAEIIRCCGGAVLPSMPRAYKARKVVITCAQDAPQCSTPSRVGLPILSAEFLLTGVLKQEATPEAFVLPPVEMPSA